MIKKKEKKKDRKSTLLIFTTTPKCKKQAGCKLHMGHIGECR